MAVSLVDIVLFFLVLFFLIPLLLYSLYMLVITEYLRDRGFWHGDDTHSPTRH